MDTRAHPAPRLLCPRAREAAADLQAERHDPTTGLPRDLEADLARRLRVVALLYAFVFFVAGPLSALLQPDERRLYFASPLGWVPTLASIVAALGVASLTMCSRQPTRRILAAGLWLQVIGSYGVAAAQYSNADRYAAAPPWAGLSWVAVWMLSYAIMVPAPPRRALVAALGSATAVPVVTVAALGGDGASLPIPALSFALRVVLPYLLVVVIAYVGARLVHRLGAELTRARELGGYRLIEPIGHGGMGEVWRAEHRLLARPAAIKLIRPDSVTGPGSNGSELRARFTREAQATSALRSPHTIELYDFGVADDGTFFYVMELLDGFDLQVLVERFGPVPVSRAVHLMIQVCHSLAEAHDGGLVHRDVKPANIYACRYGGDVDFVKVLDFGLVKPVTHDGGATLPTLTGAPLARGTPGFMAPEQALGASEVDGRADLYALGCLGYWLVTGKPVFEGRSPVETMVHHLQSEPEPPSRRAPQPVPKAFDAVILWCLAKDPDRRPPSAHVVSARLQALAREVPWTREDAQRWWSVYDPGDARANLASPAWPSPSPSASRRSSRSSPFLSGDDQPRTWAAASGTRHRLPSAGAPPGR